MNVEIVHTQNQDITEIFKLYDDAIAYQKEVGNNHWLGFEESLVQTEINERRHFKMMAKGELVGTFCIAYSDAAIWQFANETSAIYIHRIAASKNSRGLHLVKHIVDWAKTFAGEHGISYIRMDTGSGNDRLINYYIRCGFSFLGDTSVAWSPGLPAHYQNGSFALLEMHI